MSTKLSRSAARNYWLEDLEKKVDGVQLEYGEVKSRQLERGKIIKAEIPPYDKLLMLINNISFQPSTTGLELLESFSSSHNSMYFRCKKSHSFSLERVAKLEKNLNLALTGCLQVAELLEIPPNQVTPDQVKFQAESMLQREMEDQKAAMEQEEIAAELIRKELLLERSDKNKKAKRNKKSKHKFNRGSNKTDLTLLEPTAVVSKVPKIKVQKVNPQVNFVKEIYETKPYLKDLSRVTKRWSTKEIIHLRQISDRDLSGQIVYKYRELSDEDIRIQRIRHYLPGLENILCSPVCRKIYTLPVEGGFKMHAELHYSNKIQKGFIEFGVNDEIKRVFHRCFVPYKDVLKIFSPIESRESELNELEGDQWEYVSKTNYDLQPDGTLKVSFKKEKHHVVIYPLRPEILNQYLQSLELKNVVP